MGTSILWYQPASLSEQDTGHKTKRTEHEDAVKS